MPIRVDLLQKNNCSSPDLIWQLLLVMMCTESWPGLEI
jgi:hypothetical protein